MKPPDFLIIGAARCGTTTLYSWLQAHPGIYLPAEKRPEPHFFLKDEEYEKGFDYYLERWFAGRGDRIAGEASTSYLCHAHVARRVRCHLPDARFIVLLRDPAERAWSSYWHTRNEGHEDLSFEQAIEREPERLASYADPFWRIVRPHAYVERGFYHAQLQGWLASFPREQLGIWLLEDLVERPQATWIAILRFLGADERVGLNDSGALNRATPGDRRLPAPLREALIERFRPDVQALEALLGRDLSHWLEVGP